MTQLHTCKGVATTIRTDENGALCVQYHRTIVWQRTAEGSIILRTGGYRTATTKTRMNQAFNQFGPSYYRVFQRKGDWFVRISGTEAEIPFDDDPLILSKFLG